MNHRPSIDISQSVSDRVYAELRARIVSGSAAPQQLIQEASIVREAGASRTPVREALRRLEAEGLIARGRAGAYIVTELSPEELMDLYDVRGILEGHAARLAAERRGRVELARLEDTIDAMEAAVRHRDDALLAALNSDFHDLIAESSRNRYLQTQIRGIREHFDRYRSTALTAPGRREQSHGEHVALMQAIAGQDLDAAERLARGHARKALRLRVDNQSDSGLKSQNGSSRPGEAAEPA